MTFLEAMKSGRPIRRASVVYSPPWLNLGDKPSLGGFRYPWIRIDTGDEVTLARHDYVAEDWEVMP